MSALSDFRQNTVDPRLVDFERICNEAPAVSVVMLKHLEKVFSTPEVRPGTPYLSDHLIFQAGVQSVLNHMRGLNERQENNARETLGRS